MTYYGSRLTATFFDRRFEFYGAYYQGSSQLKSIRDKDGNVWCLRTTPKWSGAM